MESGVQGDMSEKGKEYTGFSMEDFKSRMQSRLHSLRTDSTEEKSSNENLVVARSQSAQISHA